MTRRDAPLAEDASDVFETRSWVRARGGGIDFDTRVRRSPFPRGRLLGARAFAAKDDPRCRNGEQVLEAFPDQGSSILTSLSWADGLAIIPVHTTIQAGEPVEYLPFSGLL